MAKLDQTNKVDDRKCDAVKAWIETFNGMPLDADDLLLSEANSSQMLLWLGALNDVAERFGPRSLTDSIAEVACALAAYHVTVTRKDLQ